MEKSFSLWKTLKQYFHYLELLGYKEIPSFPEILNLLGKKTTGNTWEDLWDKIEKCQECSLYRIRKNPVVDRNWQEKNLMIIGEFPDREEDYFGTPFAAENLKELLQKMLFSIGLKREDFYITLVVKCKPPAGKIPEEENIKVCSKFLFQEIELLRPKLILAFGFLPPKVFLEKKDALSNLRGTPFTFRESILLFTYHPSYILKNPSVKRLIWEDLKLFRSLYEEIKKTN